MKVLNIPAPFLLKSSKPSNNFKTEVLVEGVEAVPGMFSSCTLMAVDL